MNQRNAYLIQILEKIGTPLVTAVLAEDDGQTRDDAEKVAVLLAKTVQLSIDLGRIVEIDKSSPNEIEPLRVAMAGLAGPMIADYYRAHAKIPGDQDLKKLTGALEAVMTFSDNFTPASEHVIRLENMKANALPVDAYQTGIQFVQAFVPVADAIAGFSFGQPERKMVMDVADRITAKARQIHSDIFGQTEDEQQGKLGELALVRSLADIYTQCHKVELERLTAQQDPGDNAQQRALDALWKGFDLRAEMLGTLAGNLVPRPPQSAASAHAPAMAATATTTQPVQSPAAPLPPPMPAAPPPAQNAAPSPVAAQAGGNPMAMFAKPRSEDEGQPAPMAPPAAPQPYTPPVMPMEQPVAAPPPQSPPQQNGGNPMAFFKTPPKDSDE